MSDRIDVIGHSFVRRLQTCMIRRTVPEGMSESPFYPDFGLGGMQVRFHGYCPPGSQQYLSLIEHAVILTRVHLWRYYCVDPPHAVILHVGGNDADSSGFNLDRYMETLDDLLGTLLSFRVSRIVVCSVLPRFQRRRRGVLAFFTSLLVNLCHSPRLK